MDCQKAIILMIDCNLIAIIPDVTLQYLKNLYNTSQYLTVLQGEVFLFQTFASRMLVNEDDQR